MGKDKVWKHWRIKSDKREGSSIPGNDTHYSQKGKFVIDMVDYVTKMVTEFFKENTLRKVRSPWTDNLFTVNSDNNLNQKLKDIFHTTTAQGLFACKRARNDIAPAIAFLTRNKNIEKNTTRTCGI
jgi:hypothetical protein